jgi:hypothetical protein
VSTSSRNVTDEATSAERFALYRLCECAACRATGKKHIETSRPEGIPTQERCPECRGEGRTRDLVATCATPEAVGVALVTLGREGEWNECPVGVLDTMGEPGEKWIVTPWLPSARNLSDAGRTLRQAQETK